MNSYAIQRQVLSAKLSPMETVVGMVIALHLNRKTDTIEITQTKIAQECNCTDRVVRKAIRKLEDAGVFTSRRAKGKTVICPCPAKPPLEESVYIIRSNRNQRSGQSGTTVPVKGKNRMPWDYDTTHSTKYEEEQKRPLLRGIDQDRQLSGSGLNISAHLPESADSQGKNQQ